MSRCAWAAVIIRDDQLDVDYNTRDDVMMDSSSEEEPVQEDQPTHMAAETPRTPHISAQHGARPMKIVTEHAASTKEIGVMAEKKKKRRRRPYANA